jgi:hypothetical protein
VTSALIWVVAYLITGLLYVRRDMKQPAWNRPSYANSASGRTWVRALWLLVSLRILWMMAQRSSAVMIWKFARTEALPSYATFIGLGIVGTYFGS